MGKLKGLRMEIVPLVDFKGSLERAFDIEHTQFNLRVVIPHLKEETKKEASWLNWIS